MFAHSMMAARRQAGALILALCTTCSVMVQLLTSKDHSTFTGPRHHFAGDRSSDRSCTRLLSSEFQHSWLELSEGPTLSPDSDAQVMPVFPLRTIEWPGTSVEIKVVDPACRRMYDDLLSSGRRYIVAPLSCLPTRGGRPDAETPPEERRLLSMGSVLMLEDLKDVSDQTDGAIKYLAKHTVVGRANIKRILNPSALFKSDLSNADVNYLKAEVELLPESRMEVVNASWVKDFVDIWEELRALSESLDEPRLESKSVIRQSVIRSTSYQLADLWQRLQVQSTIYRDKARVHTALRNWIETEQQQGRLPEKLPSQLNLQAIGTPQALIEAYTELATPGAVTLSKDFWDPLLNVLAEDDAEERRRKLRRLAQEEVKITRARSSLRSMLG